MILRPCLARALALMLVLLAGSACTGGGDTGRARDPGGASPGGASPGGASPGQAQAPVPDRPLPSPAEITTWVYQLQGYDGDGLAAIAGAPGQLAVVDLARDARSGFFRADEVAALRRSGKRVLAYFEIGSIEDFRPEYGELKRRVGQLVLNRWADWPNEYFVRYWEGWWFDQVVGPRVDQALRAGFDGVYLDTPLAYEEIDLNLVPGQDRDSLGRAMVDLIARISRHAKAQRSDFWIVPQNSPELRRIPGFTDAIDGIGMEELFFLATDRPCAESYCTENLDHARALRAAGKLVLAVDYARKANNVRAACGRYATERFAGYVTVRELDRITAPCKMTAVSWEETQCVRPSVSSGWATSA